MGAVVVDASVVIGFYASGDAHHDLVVREIVSARRRGDWFVLPATVLSEVMVGRLRRDPASAAERHRRTVRRFGPVRVVDEDIAIEAARLRAAQRALRLPDALVIATGIIDDADAVLTCDARWADVDERVRVLQ